MRCRNNFGQYAKGVTNWNAGIPVPLGRQEQNVIVEFAIPPVLGGVVHLIFIQLSSAGYVESVPRATVFKIPTSALCSLSPRTQKSQFHYPTILV